MQSRVDLVTGKMTVTDGDRVARASLLRVPGRDGHGAYMGEVCILDITDEMPLRESIADSIQDLSDALERRGFGTRSISIPATLVYSGAWAPGALETQVEYDPLKDPLRVGEACRRFFNLLWANLPGEWKLVAGSHLIGMEVVCHSPRGLTTAVYDSSVVARAADDGHLDKLASAAAQVFLISSSSK